MRPLYRGPVPTFLSVRGVRGRQVDDYKVYGGYLAARLGEYCSYCEVALGGCLAVEHIVAKSTQPQVDAKWVNFLLACTNCNSTKGSVVKQARELGSYVWPCDTSINTATIFTYDLVTEDGVQFVKVRAVNGAYRDRALRTIELFALNRVRDDDAKVSDRRVTNRTQAWRDATALIDLLQARFVPYNNMSDPVAAVAAAASDAAINVLVTRIGRAARATGFWSVWMTVLLQNGRRFINDAVRQQLAADLFCKTFPGTNFTAGNYSVTIPANYRGLPG